MTLPYFENTAKTIQFILIWIVFAAFQTLTLSYIIHIPLWMLLVDSVIHSIIYGGLCILLWAIFNYGNYEALTLYQRIINYCALAIMTISIWVGVSFGSFSLCFGNEFSTVVIPFLPLRGFIGLLIFSIIMQQFKIKNTQIEPETNKSTQVEAIENPRETKETEILERIAVKSGSKIHVILIPDIVFLQSEGDYVQIFTTNGKYLKEQTMKYFEDHLPESLFVRVHRSHIVNVEMISRIELYEKQNQMLTLKNGQQIKTSPAGYKALRTVLNL